MSNKLLFINPTSGNGAGKKYLQRTDVTVVITDPKNIQQQLLTHVQAQDIIIIAGGDGTVNLVISGLYKTGLYDKVSVALFPLGTGNDLSKAFNLNVSSFEQLLKNIDQAKSQPLAIWRFGEHVFTNYLSTGLDAKSLAAVSRWREHVPNNRWLTLLLYAYAGIKNLFSRKRYTIKLNEKTTTLVSLVLTSIPTYGGGCVIENHNQATTPCLNAIFVATRWQLIKLMATRFSKRPYPSTAIQAPLQLTSDSPYLQVDGEMLPDTEHCLEFCGHINLLSKSAN